MITKVQRLSNLFYLQEKYRNTFEQASFLISTHNTTFDLYSSPQFSAPPPVQMSLCSPMSWIVYVAYRLQLEIIIVHLKPEIVVIDYSSNAIRNLLVSQGFHMLEWTGEAIDGLNTGGSITKPRVCDGDSC